jgi:dTDP-4-amino-4,6-dideoxygalactose transaminase
MSEMEAAVDTVQMQKMEQTVGRFRRVKRRVVEQLATYREIVPQMANDADGEVGYSLRFFPADVKLGKQVVEALQAEGINAGSRCGTHRDDWHIYYDMFPLLYHHQNGGGACGTGCARSAHRGPHPSYFRGACPVADDLFDRVINIGLNQWHSDTDCDNIARGITKVLDAFCTRDPKGRTWR